MSEVELMDTTVKPATSEAPGTEPSAWMPLDNDFRSNAPEDVIALIDKKGYKGLGDFFKSYTDMEKFKGDPSRLVIPEADDVEGWNKLFNATGRPETAEGYKFENNTGIDLSDELMSGFKAFAHKEGHSQKQFAGIVQFQLEAIKASGESWNTQQAEKKEENIQAMRQKWQNDYNPTMVKIDAVAEKLQVKEYFEQLGIDKEPQIVNMLLTIANSDSEEELTETGEKIVTATSSDELSELMKTDAFTDKFHKDHKTTMTRFMELNREIANSGQGRAPQN